MDDLALLTWFEQLIALNGGHAALKLAKTREGYVSKFGTFTSPPSASLHDSLLALRDGMRKAMVGA